MLNIVELLWQQTRGKHERIIAVALAAGLGNAAALHVVNTAAQSPSSLKLWTFLAFALSLALFFSAASATSHQINAAIEETLHTLKSRLVKKIELTELARIEQIGASEIRDRITTNVMAIANAGSQVGSILQSLSIFFFAILYLAWLSLPTLCILVGLQLGVLYIYRSRRTLVNLYLGEQAQTRIKFLDRLMDLLKGAKEVRLNSSRCRDILADFEATSLNLGQVSAKTNRAFEDNLLVVTVNLYVLLAAVVYLLPGFFDLPPDKLTKLVASILFVWGSAQTGLVGYLAYVEANQALVAIATLEEKLDHGASPQLAAEDESSVWPGSSGLIEARQLEYEYPVAPGETAFHIGPIDLRIEPGELVFVVGGNGAGKSTFLKVLTGLYPLTRGSLRVGSVTVRPDNLAAYRELISAIFADFHLFSKLYGLLDVEPQAVQGLLKQMEIAHKTAFADGRFTTRSLSTGQKKRLAMIVALLEDRPIFVLDEWAADQDPEFRRYFYENLLPSLKQRGKTIIAVSHDDRYYHCADRVVFLEYGVIRSIQKLKPSDAAPAHGA